MHVGIANSLWRGKRSRHSRRMHNPQFYVSGKRPMSATCADHGLLHSSSLEEAVLSESNRTWLGIDCWHHWCYWPAYNLVGDTCSTCRESYSALCDNVTSWNVNRFFSDATAGTAVQHDCERDYVGQVINIAILIWLPVMRGDRRSSNSANWPSL